MRHPACCLLVAALAAAAGCGGGDDPKPRTQAERPAPRPPAPEAELDRRVPDAEVHVIQGWIGAMNRHDYPAAASFFAPGAIVDQGRPLALVDRKAAIAWNSALPCDADLTSVRRVRGRPLATFSLREGPGGPCEGEASVRFTIRDGKIILWEQLPERRGGPTPEQPVI